MKVTKDGFVWLLVNDEAKEIFNTGLFQLYEVRQENGVDMESMINTFEELNECLENGCDIGIEVGQLPAEKNVDIIQLLSEKFPNNTDEKLADLSYEEYNEKFLIMVDWIIENFLDKSTDESVANDIVERYMSEEN